MAPINLSAAFATVLCGAAAAYVFLWSLLHLTHGKDEPPMVSTSIPFVSPILGSKSVEDGIPLLNRFEDQHLRWMGP